MRSRLNRRCILILVAACLLPLQAVAAEPVTIFAAATLKDALDAVAAAAESESHIPVRAVYGPTPALVKQLENGGPGDIFFSADPDWMNEAVAHKIVDPATRIDLLASKLVLIATAGKSTPAKIEPGFPLRTMLGDGRLAICDPMMMPAGRYGRAALQKLGVWDSVKDRVANADTIRAALTYVSRGEAPLGIVFDTDAKLDSGVMVVGTFPADSHPAILYPVAAVAANHNAGTPAILRFLASPAAKPIFEKFGYSFLPKAD